MIIQTVPITESKHRVVGTCVTMDALEGWISVPELPPEPESAPVGKTYLLFYNPITQELWYEMIDRPLTEDEEIAELKQVIADLAQLLIEKGVLSDD